MGQQHSQGKTGMREAKKRSMKRLNGWLGLLLLGLVSASLCLLSAGEGPLLSSGRDETDNAWGEAAAGIAGQGDWQGDWPKREHR